MSRNNLYAQRKRFEQHKQNLKSISRAKRLLLTLSASAVLATGLAFPAFAASKAAPKATGGVGYTAYGVQRYAEFDAHQTSQTCTIAWNVTGNYKVDFVWNGVHNPYPYDLTLLQTGSSVSGEGQYPSPGPNYQYAWSVSGTVSDNSIALTDTYTLGAIGTIMHMNGVIAPNGSMSGTWDDNYGGTRTGTWSTTTGAAELTGCTGKGTFSYSDVNGDWYEVNIQNVQVEGNKAWFAGPVTSGNVGAGNWLFAEVKDVSTPGSKGDLIWGSFTSEYSAKVGVANMSYPSDGPFNITSGNLVVH